MNKLILKSELFELFMDGQYLEDRPISYESFEDAQKALSCEQSDLTSDECKKCEIRSRYIEIDVLRALARLG